MPDILFPHPLTWCQGGAGIQALLLRLKVVQITATATITERLALVGFWVEVPAANGALTVARVTLVIAHLTWKETSIEVIFVFVKLNNIPFIGNPPK